MIESAQQSEGLKHRFMHGLDYIFVLRPTLCYPVWTVALAGFWSQERVATGEPWFSSNWPQSGFGLTDLLALALFTLVMGASFLVNQITDIESDRLNNKLYLIASGSVTVRQAWMETLLLLGVGLGGLFMVNSSLALVALLSFLVTGWAYSCAPLNGKNRPWAGFAANLTGAALIFVFGWLMAGASSASMALRGLPFILGIGAVYLLTTIPDRPGDAAANKITLAVHWGEERVYPAALIAGSLAVMAAWLAREGVAAAATVRMWPFFWRTARRRSVDSALRTNKFAVLILSMLICWRVPCYLVVLAAVYYFSKWYYKLRFKVHYPSLRT